MTAPAALEQEIKKNLETFKQHLTGVALPAWIEKGWDNQHGGFHEKLEGGKPVDLGYKRLTATARQLFVFSEWSKRWNPADCAKMAHKTFDYLMTHFWDKETDGWIAKVTTEGKASDKTHDLYSTAFAIFALARYGKIFSNAQAIATARKTMSIIDTRMRHPFAGYVTAADMDWEPVSKDLDQNPHMHLLEALQVLNDAGAEPATIAREEKVAKLMAEVFYDKERTVVREHFDAQGKPHPVKGNVVEPGHQFEWYWLIRGGSRRAYGQSYASIVGHMFDWGVKHGVDQARGGVYDVCDIQGKATQSTKRIWPTTEYLRAAACRWNIQKDQAALSLLNDQLKLFLKNYLNPSGWNESLNEDMTPNRSDMPVTTSYHLSTAYFDSAAMFGL